MEKRETQQFPKGKEQTIQVPTPVPLSPCHLPLLPRLTAEASVLWGTEWNLPSPPCQGKRVLGKLFYVS